MIYHFPDHFFLKYTLLVDERLYCKENQIETQG
jgi:hypothetical protein